MVMKTPRAEPFNPMFFVLNIPVIVDVVSQSNGKPFADLVPLFALSQFWPGVFLMT